jgi:tetratricopeptide (TPR) repeat protein
MRPPSESRGGLEAGGLAHTQLLQEDFLARIETRLAIDPGAVELHVERAHLLAELQRPKEAACVYRDALKIRAPKYPVTSRAYSILPYTGKTLPITVLLLVAPEWGNAPFRKYLSDQAFLVLQVIPDFHDPKLALPPHQLVINCISEADSCESSLRAAEALLEGTSAPVINAPAAVQATGRESNARRLASVPGVKCARVEAFTRDFLLGDGAAAALANRGFSFPLLLRSPGHHTGLHFLRVETPEGLKAGAASLPGDTLWVMEFLKAQSADGYFRKYRVMMIDGKFYPAHLAISENWKAHYFSAAMADFPAHREEDKNFLEQMPQVLGPRVMETLRRLHDVLKLDYCGIDFSIGPDRELILFEANATMHVPAPESNEIWSYRAGPIGQISSAIQIMFFTKAFPVKYSKLSSPAQILKEHTLRQIESLLAREPDRVELKIEQARLLIEMERFEEAKDIYLKILEKDPTQFVALNNLGTLLSIMGYHEAALKVYREVAKLIPDNAKARVNLAHSLRETGELEEARREYEATLQLVPDYPEAHEGLSYVLMYLGHQDDAWKHQKTAFQGRAPRSFAHHDEGERPRILILASPCGGNSPITRLLENKHFATLRVITDFHDESVPLPPHDLILNAIGDADLCGTSLRGAERILEKISEPVLNPPSRIRTTGRVENARILGALEDVLTPRIITLSREILEGKEAFSALEQHGFTFPLLLRSPGFHGGSYFVRVDSPDALASAVGTLPGAKQLVIQYLEARNDDGKIRKYRVMMVNGRLYPLHKAVSRDWMIHYYSAEMAQSAEHRAEDAAFLEDMPGVLGSRAMKALERIRDALGLDYGGIDFSLNAQGQILLFEANATMAVPNPDRGEKWDFRREPVERIKAVTREMVLERVREVRRSVHRSG